MINKLTLFSVLALFSQLSHANNLNESSNWKKITPNSDQVKCADGSPYSFYYKEGNDNLLVYMNGGGACWDFDSCSSLDQKKYPINTYEETADLPYNKPGHWKGMLDFSNVNNPVKDWSILSLPYCTADLFIGESQNTYRKDGEQITIYHYGKNNVDYALSWLQENKSDTINKKLIAGSSSGGYGAMFNAEKVNKVLPSNETYVFFDASDGVVSREFEKSVFSRDSVWGYKSTEHDYQNFILYNYQKIISSNQEIDFASYTTSKDIMQTLFFNIMGTPPNSWLDLSSEKSEEWSEASSYNHSVLLRNNNYNLYLENDCIHSGLRYDDSFNNSLNKIKLNSWMNDFLNNKNYSYGLEFLFRSDSFTPPQKNNCISRAINSVKRT